MATAPTIQSTNAVASKPTTYRIYYLALLLGMALTFSSLLLITIPEGPKFGLLKGVTRRVAEVHHRITQDTRPVDVAFLGSSHTWTAISDAQIQRELVSLGLSVRVSNLASTWMGRDLHLFYLKQLLIHKHPRLVVIEMTDHEFAFGHDLLPYVGELSDLFCCKPYLDPTFPSHFALFLKHKVNTTLELARHPWDETKSSEAPSEFGWLAVAKNWPQAPANDQAPNLRQILKYQAYSLTSAYGRSVVEQMAALAKQHNAKIAFIYLPVYEYALREPASGFDFYESKGPIITIPKEIASNSKYWFDESHINKVGAEAIAPKIAGSIHKILTSDTQR